MVISDGLPELRARGHRVTIRAALSTVSDPSAITVTTGTPATSYEVLGAISFFYSSRTGIFTASLEALMHEYRDSTSRQTSVDYRFLFDDVRAGKAFEQAFLVTTQELRRRAAALGAHAVIEMSHDVDLVASDSTCLYVRVSGTAVRFRR
jgi:hypothetical protein